MGVNVLKIGPLLQHLRWAELPVGLNGQPVEEIPQGPVPVGVLHAPLGEQVAEGELRPAAAPGLNGDPARFCVKPAVHAIAQSGHGHRQAQEKSNHAAGKVPLVHLDALHGLGRRRPPVSRCASHLQNDRQQQEDEEQGDNRA